MQLICLFYFFYFSPTTKAFVQPHLAVVKRQPRSSPPAVALGYPQLTNQRHDAVNRPINDEIWNDSEGLEGCANLLEGEDNSAHSSTADVLAGPTSSSLTMTPCVRICRYSADFYDGVVCIGCFREAFEIGLWNSFTATEKLYAYQYALDRCSNANSESFLFPGSVSQAQLERQKSLLERAINTGLLNESQWTTTDSE